MVIMLASLIIDAHILFTYEEYHWCLRMIHELYLHLPDSKGWHELLELSVKTKNFPKLTKDKYRFLLASLGVLMSQRLYRSNSRKITTPELSTSVLLEEIEAFAREQIKFNPGAPNGYHKLGWVSQQFPKKRGTHPLAAAADCFYWYQKAYQIADQSGNTMVSAEARIDAAFVLTTSAAGMIGIDDAVAGTAIVQREFRTQFGEKELLPGKSQHGSSKNKKKKKPRKKNDPNCANHPVLIPIKIVSCANVVQGKKLMEYESDRVRKGVPTTSLNKGE